jgi:SAM-dependent methyltransferase
LNEIKHVDVERFSRPTGSSTSSLVDAFWTSAAGRVGSRFARSPGLGAAIDLTSTAVDLARRFLIYKGLDADVREANVSHFRLQMEIRPVVSSGVLHHTPNVQKALSECHRVLKRGAPAKLTFYHKGLLHEPIAFRATRTAMRLFGVKHPGADLARTSVSVDDFIRQYDGAGNPVGVGKTTTEWTRDLAGAGFTVKGHELHFFPKRFLPLSSVVPTAVHRWLDSRLGTMIYFRLEKPA